MEIATVEQNSIGLEFEPASLKIIAGGSYQAAVDSFIQTAIEAKREPTVALMVLRIIDGQCEVLISSRHKEGEPVLALPGGHIDPADTYTGYEDPILAALREGDEEGVGLTPDLFNPTIGLSSIQTSNDTNNDKHHLSGLVFALAKPGISDSFQTGEPENHDDWVWMPLTELVKMAIIQSKGGTPEQEVFDSLVLKLTHPDFEAELNSFLLNFPQMFQ